jgi:hypothetical protein
LPWIPAIAALRAAYPSPDIPLHPGSSQFGVDLSGLWFS